MTADRLEQAKEPSKSTLVKVGSLVGGMGAALLVFYLGYTNAAASGGLMPERNYYRLFCYTVSLPVAAFLRIVPLDSWISLLLAQFFDLALPLGPISRSALINISLRSLLTGLLYAWLLALGGQTWAYWAKLKRQGQLVWTRRCTWILLTIVGLAVALVFYLRQDVGAYRISAYRLHLKGLPASLTGLRLVFFADLHAGTYSQSADLLRAASLINSLQPDILVGGGDYVFGGRERFAKAAAWMGLLRPRLAFIGVLGNHDYWHGSDSVEKACAAGGLRLLKNERLFINEEREVSLQPPRRGLCLAGVGDLWSAPVAIDKALAQVAEDMPRVLFSHNPDIIFERYNGQDRVDFIISGHTHGGQVLLPWGTSLGVSTNYPQQLTSGWYRAKGCQIYTNVGLGETVVPFRCGVRPEITLLILDSASYTGVEEICAE